MNGSEDPDQIARMFKLIFAFARRIFLGAHFIMVWIKKKKQNKKQNKKKKTSRDFGYKS